MPRLAFAVLAVLVVGVGVVMMSLSGPKQHSFVSFDGVPLCFYDSGGAGRPVILLHGLIVDSEINFGLKPYEGTGRRVILLDARGHGCSDKPHNPKAYGDRAMARDVLALIDHLKLSSVDLLGYSLGGYTAMEAAMIGVPPVSWTVMGLEIPALQRRSFRS